MMHRTGSRPEQFRPLRWVLAALIMLMVLGLTACERPAWLPWPVEDAPDAASLDSAEPITAPPAAGDPFPELDALRQQVADLRAILPDLPPGAGLPPEPPRATPPATREVLRGAGQWVRRGSSAAGLAPPAGLPATLSVTLWLDDRLPPAGALHVSGQGLPQAPWTLLSSYATGPRNGAFDYSFRVAAPDHRLWFFKLVGLPFEHNGAEARSVEGYLVPAAALETDGGLYVLNFGPPWLAQPAVVTGARAMGLRFAEFALRLERLEALPGEMTRSTQTQEALRQAQVPQGQEAKRRSDLQAEEQRLRDLQREQAALATELRPALRRLMQDRAIVARDWLAHAQGNAYRWLTPPERAVQAAAVQALAAQSPLLERGYRALAGDTDATLAEARQTLRAALDQEQTALPAP